MLPSVLLLLLGLALLLAGGDALVRGASTLAARLGVSEQAVGLTVVAFGTSAPELLVSLLAALRGDSGVAFGNVVGSNIANVSLLLGATALLAPLTVRSAVVAREIPVMILASAATLLLGLDALLDGRGPDLLGRADGLLLLLLFVGFLYVTVTDVLRGRSEDPLLEGPAVPPVAGAPAGRLTAALLVVGGLAGLGLGGQLLVSSATSIAEAAGVPSVVIGSTIVAVGTSLPELATSLLAVRRGQHDIALGNLVGSNIFNLLFILGGTAAISPVDVPAGGALDLAVMALLAAGLLPLAWSGRRISRAEGGVLLAAYGGYVAWQLTRG